ncbi:hypothetical protein GGF50DRAFT_43509, partial [Schizophyllum commune]
MRRSNPHYNGKKARSEPRSDKGKGKEKAATPELLPRRERRRARRRLADAIYEAVKARHQPDGLGSRGVRALRLPVYLRTLNSPAVEGRLDSGADITLLSEDEYLSWPVKERPIIREGMRMRLYHLTGETKVLGYVKFPLFAEADSGELVRFDVEAYVVRGMKVPLLLGEDFQTTYELGVTRTGSGDCKVAVGSSGKVLSASSKRVSKPGFKIRRANNANTYRLPKTKAGARARARRFPGGPAEVCAAEDVVLAPHAVHNVPVMGAFEGRSDWLVEKVIMSGMDASLMASPTTWIDAEDARIPIANPSARPQFLKRGDV